MYNQGLFHPWVPKLIQLLLIVVIALVFFGLNPIYTSNLTYLSASSGNNSEYYLWANYAFTIGMGMVMPLIIRLKARFRTKELLVTSLVSIALLYIILATTQQVGVILGASFLMGVFKLIGMMEVLLPLMVILTKVGNRGTFYAIFYSAVLIVTQYVGYWATKVAYLENWQSANYILALICLATAGVCVVTQHNMRFMRKVPLYYIDWISIVLYVVCFTILGYVLSFGKQLDWFNSPRITYATLIFALLLFLFIIRQQIIERPFLSLKAFSKTTVLHGIVMLFFLGMYLATTNLQSIYAVAILGYTPLTNASLNLLLIPGMVLGGFICYRFFKKGYTLEVLTFSGFAAFLFYSAFMYFGMSLEFNYELWYVPMLFKGYGMIVLFVVVWYYTLDKLDLVSLLGLVGFVLLWRTFISVGLFTSVFTSLQYHLQWESVHNLALYLDSAILYNSPELLNLQSFQINAVLASNKTIFGYICLASIGILLYVIFVHVSTKTTKNIRFDFINGKIKLSKKDAKSIKKHLQ